MDSKQLLKEVLSGGEAETVPVAPIVFSFAACLRALSPREMLSDATLLANSLTDALELFGYDAVVTWFDTTLEAEACGCELDWSAGTPRVVGSTIAAGGAGANLELCGIEDRGRVPVAAEVARRLNATVGREATLLGAVTGPLTLFRHLRGCSHGEASRGDAAAAADLMEQAGAVATRMVRLYGELGLDGVIIAEDVPPDELLEGLPGALAVYDQLFGIVRYFDSHTVFMARRYPDDGFTRLVEELLPDCMAIADSTEPEAAVLKCREESIVPAAAVPVEALLAGPEDTMNAVERFMEVAAGGGFLLTTSWEVPPGAPLESVRAMVCACGR